MKRFLSFVARCKNDNKGPHAAVTARHGFVAQSVPLLPKRLMKALVFMDFMACFCPPPPLAEMKLSRRDAPGWDEYLSMRFFRQCSSERRHRRRRHPSRILDPQYSVVPRANGKVSTAQCKESYLGTYELCCAIIIKLSGSITVNSVWWLCGCQR